MAPSTPSDVAPALRANGLSRAWLALVVAVTGLIVLGAGVRAFEAGLACPDWPLCFGAVIPEMNLEVAFEFSHRVLAGCISLVFVFLAVRTWPLEAMRRNIAVVGLLLLVQIVLGGLTVLELLAEWTVTSHLVTGNAVNAGILWLGLRLRDQGRPVERNAISQLGRAILLATVALGLAQMVLGGLVASSYAGLACPEWPTCNGGQWVPTWNGTVGLHLFHRFNGYAFGAALLLGAFALRGSGRLATLAVVAAVLGGIQILVGISNVLLGLPEGVTILHSALAALLVLTLTASVREWIASPAETGAQA
jgi:cytochrome c oxidase assembly protein subunit 15